MKWVPISFVLACVLIVNGQEKRPEPKPYQKNAQSEKPTPAPTIGTNVVNQQAPAQQENRPADHPQSYLCRLFSPENLPNIGLFIVGVIGTIVAVCTLRDIQKQTQNTRTIADAALLNAQAIINSERPWVLVTAVRSEKIGNFLIRATIKGRTPARITEIYSQRTFIDQPDNLPPSPKYETPVIAPKEPLLGDGESFKIAEVKPNILVDEEWKAKHPNFAPYQFLCFYGIVRYEDCLATDEKRRHETRWCFSYFTDGDNDLHPIGPEEYCRKT